jgi:hypothetical protein
MFTLSIGPVGWIALVATVTAQASKRHGVHQTR